MLPITDKSKSIEEALEYSNWLVAIKEELNQFERNNVCELVSKPNHQKVIGTEYVFKNKMEEPGFITKNKARLVLQKGIHKQKV